MRLTPGADDPYFERDIGACPGCAECDPPETEADLKCGTCGGRGTVNPLTAPAEFFCTGTTDCPSCDGTGEIQ